jgi:hypothetical protein
MLANPSQPEHGLTSLTTALKRFANRACRRFESPFGRAGGRGASVERSSARAGRKGIKSGINRASEGVVGISRNR